MTLKSIYEPDNHYGFLDGIRGIAVLLVIFSHTSNERVHIIPHFDLAAAGKMGVWLFFTLSALLLTSKLLSSVERNGFTIYTVATYAVARFARIFPLYIPVIFVYWFFGRLTASEIAPHLLLLEGKSIFWAIPVECKFYFALPLLALAYVKAFNNRLLPFAITLYALAIVTMFAWPLGEVTLNSLYLGPYFSIFIAGVIGAMVLHNSGTVPAKPLLCAILVVIAVITLPTVGNALLALLGISAIQVSIYHNLGPFQSVIWMVLLGQALVVDWLRSAFSSRFLQWTGRISFSLYLWHILILEKTLQANMIPVELKGAATLAISYLVSAISYNLIERPGINTGKIISKKIMAKAGA